MACSKPIILVIGCTGKTGQLIAEDLEKHKQCLTVRWCSRRLDQVDAWRKQGRDAVFLDLDQPSTFALALFGVERLFLCTGYSVAMLTQSKTIVDAAKRANVKHIVHFGVFTDRITTVSAFAWHDLVEAYIEHSGIAWTHLHPNTFMENLHGTAFFDTKTKTIFDFFAGQRVGWVAVADIAKVAAVVLREGPEKHAGKDYWLSSEVLNMKQVAEVFGEVFGTTFLIAVKSTEGDFDRLFVDPPGWPEKAWFLEGIRTWLKQVRDGELGSMGTVRDDVPYLTGTESLKLKDWVIQNKSTFQSNF